jgi:hypothetical protein
MPGLPARNGVVGHASSPEVFAYERYFDCGNGGQYACRVRNWELLPPLGVAAAAATATACWLQDAGASGHEAASCKPGLAFY